MRPHRSLLIKLALFLPFLFLVVITNFALPRHARIAITFWIIYAIFFITSVIRIVIADYRRQVRNQRADFGLCIHCGYDIRASAGICPECSAPLPATHRFGEGAK